MLNYQQMAANLLCLEATGAGEYFPWMQALCISGSFWNSVSEITYKAFR